MNVRKIVASLLVAVVMANGVSVFADATAVKAPINTSGSAAFPGYAGYKYKYVSSTTETMVCTGRCLLVAVQMSTGANTTYLNLRDTSTADGGGDLILPFIRFESASGAYENRVFVPLRTTAGISAKLTSVTAAEAVTVVYVAY